MNSNCSLKQRQVQEFVLKARLYAAKNLAACGDFEQAEFIYKSALIHAEKTTGEKSPLTGIVLLDLANFYESQGKEEDVANLDARIREILRSHSADLLREIGDLTRREIQ